MSKIKRIVGQLRSWLSDADVEKTEQRQIAGDQTRHEHDDLTYSFPHAKGIDPTPLARTEVQIGRVPTTTEPVVNNTSAPSSAQSAAVQPSSEGLRPAIHFKSSPRQVEISTDARAPRPRQPSILNRSIEGFDFASAIVMLGDEALILQMIEIFLKDSVNTIRDLTKKIDSQQHREAQYLIHSLIGTAGILGATALRNTAEQLDRALRQRYMIESAFDAFTTEFQRSTTTLMNILQSDSPADHDPSKEHGSEHSLKLQTNRNILLADDNQFVQQAMQALLNRHGWLVTIAGNGQEAVAAASRAQFDIVLMDVQMPVLDGLEATREIRQMASNQTLPIIGLSATATESERAACLESGMTDLIAKTTKPDQLIALINAHVRAQTS